jgi:hypothetical protein
MSPFASTQYIQQANIVVSRKIRNYKYKSHNINMTKIRARLLSEWGIVSQSENMHDALHAFQPHFMLMPEVKGASYLSHVTSEKRSF